MKSFLFLVVFVLLVAFRAFGDNRNPVVLEPPSDDVPTMRVQQRSGKLSDPSGSRTGEAYLRRYLTEIDFGWNVFENGYRLSNNFDQDQATAQALSRFNAEAANAGKVTFVTNFIETNKRLLDEVDYYNQKLPATPRRGNFIAPTDRLKLNLGVTLSFDDKNTGGTVRGVGAWRNRRSLTILINFSGTIDSIDTGATSYGVSDNGRPVKMQKVIDLDSGFNMRGPGIFSFIFPDGVRKTGSSSGQVSALVANALTEVARRIIPQLESAPVMPVVKRAGGEQTTLYLDAIDDDARIYYLKSVPGLQVRMGQEVLVPLISAADYGSGRKSQRVMKARISGLSPIQVNFKTLQGEVVYLDKTRPFKLLKY